MYSCKPFYQAYLSDLANLSKTSNADLVNLLHVVTAPTLSQLQNSEQSLLSRCNLQEVMKHSGYLSTTVIFEFILQVSLYLYKREFVMIATAGFSLTADGRKALMSTDRLNDAKLGELIDTVLSDKANKDLDTINLPFNEISNDGLIKLGSFLNSDFSTIRNLDLQSNNIDGKTLAKFLSHCHNLISLNLSYNTNLGADGAAAIAEFLFTNKSLQALYLSNCGFNLNSLVEIVDSLADNSTLIILELNRPIINSMGQQELCCHFSRLLQRDTSALQHLSLRNCCIDDNGVKVLIGAIINSNNLKIQSLDLEGNKIGIRGAQSLASLLLATTGGHDEHASKELKLRSKRGLRTLRISYNPLGDIGCTILAKALENNLTLDRLSLKGCGLSTSLTQLGLSLVQNKSLKCLELFGYLFDPSSCEIFAELQKRKKKRLQENASEQFDSDSEARVGSDLDMDILLYEVDGQWQVAEKDFGYLPSS